MIKLSPDARDLIEAARAGESDLAGARDQARTRVRARVLARVGAGVAAGSATALGASSTAAKTALTAGLLFKCMTVLGVAGVVAVVTVEAGARFLPPPSTPRSPPPAATLTVVQPASRAAVPADPVPVRVEPSPVAAPPAPPAPSPPPPAVRRAAPPPPALAASSLEAETALLEKAQAELRAGHPERALATLDDHDAELKGGVLREEQRAARVLALCAAGRTGEAKAEAQRFLAESPRSPMAERVRSSCGGQGAP